MPWRSEEIKLKAICDFEQAEAEGRVHTSFHDDANRVGCVLHHLLYSCGLTVAEYLTNKHPSPDPFAAVLGLDPSERSRVVFAFMTGVDHQHGVETALSVMKEIPVATLSRMIRVPPEEVY